MDEWLKEIQASLQEAAHDSSNWFAAASQEADKIANQCLDISVETLQEIESAIAPTVDEINEQVDTRLSASWVFIEENVVPWMTEATAPVTHTVTPWLQNHPTCIGCKNYHGTAYGETMLVCGIHPYGPDDKTCADWSSVWATGDGEDA